MKFGRTVSMYLYAYLMGGLATWVCNFIFMRTLCCAVFGEDWGLFAADLIRYFCWPLIAFVMIYISKARDAIVKQAYLNSKEGQTYSLWGDASEILRGSVFWTEVLIVVVLTVIYCLINPLLLLVNLPMFLIFNLGANLHLHRTWLRDRLRTF